MNALAMEGRPPVLLKGRCMLTLTAAVLAVALAGPATREDRALATPRAYPSGRADSVHRPGFNGRLYVTLSTPGPVTTHYATDSLAESYGAAGHEDAAVHAVIGQNIVTMSPWVTIDGDGRKNFEKARQQWLKEHNFVGGVRTFVNDAYIAKHLPQHAMAKAESKPSRGTIEPRAVIQIAPETPRLRSKMQVRVLPADAQLRRNPAVRVRVVDETRVASK